MCKHLLQNNNCEIYSQRPFICRIDEVYNKVFCKHMSKEEYFQKNVDACNVLQKKAGINSKHRVQLLGETAGHNKRGSYEC